MNKKVLTLCAGFLLAGSMSAFAQTFDKEMTKDGESADFYNVYVESSGEVKDGSGLLSPDGDYWVKDTKANRNNAKYQWKITRTTLGGITYYTLKNGENTAFPTVKADGKEYNGFIVTEGHETELGYWLSDDGQTCAGFMGKNDDVADKWVTTWNYKLVKATPESQNADKLNELYNSTGFNLVLNDAKWKDVANIFDDQRVKAINVPNGVKSPNTTSEKDYAFPKGTYFVVTTPAGAQPASGSDLYSWLQQCTFIAVNSVANDINDKADREAGKGFQLTTVLGRDLNTYQGKDDDKKACGTQIAAVNACFTVDKNAGDQYSLALGTFYYNKAKAADIKPEDAQVATESIYYLDVTEKDGEDHGDLYLTTNNAGQKFIFSMKEVFTQKAIDWLKTDGMAAYNIKIVKAESEASEDAEGMYLYTPAYGTTTYAKGAKFVDVDAPETQYVITDVNEADNSIEFTNRANRDITFTAKLYEEADDVYSIAIANDEDNKFNYTILTVNKDGNIEAADNASNLHGVWAEITPATVDKFAGAWDVDNQTEVTMLFARDDEPTSNKLYVRTNDKMNGIDATNKLSEAVQFQLLKSKTPEYITNIYAYKAGDKVLYKSQGDTVAYYTYQFQAYKDGRAVDSYLYNEGSNKYGLTSNEKAANKFIIKDNAEDNSVQIIRWDNADAYGTDRFVAVGGWNDGKNEDINKYVGSGIKEETIDQEILATDIRTYLNIESPDVTLDPKSTYVTMTSDLGLCITMQEDSRDAIAASNDPMTIRLFATDTDRQVPSFLVATGYDNDSKERMFLFNPADSVNYYVAEGAYDKQYQWDEGINKLIFKKAYLNEAEAAHDTLFTTVKGKEVAVSNVADNNKNVQGGLDKFKFQIVLADDEEDLYWIRQDGAYVHSLNGKLTLSDGTTVNAIKVKVEATDMPTANESINAAEAVKVVATNGAVIVKGAEGKNVVVSTILGKVVANEVLNSDNETIAAPAGIVVVSVDGESFKVAVK